MAEKDDSEVRGAVCISRKLFKSGTVRMDARAFLWSTRMWTPLPILFYSLYLVRLYLNGFWTEIVGPGQAWISIVALALAVLSWISLFPTFESKSKQTRTRCYHLFAALSITTNGAVLALAYLGRAVKRPECAYFMDLFLRANAETFFVSAFHRQYPTASDRSAFVEARTLRVHDAGLCMALLSGALFWVLRRNLDGLVELQATPGQAREKEGDKIDIGAIPEAKYATED
jgi:hypothetical protein